MSRDIMLDTPEGIVFHQLLARRAALKLEILGLKHRGGSVYALCKRAYGLKGSKQRVLEQLDAMVEELKATHAARKQHGVNPPALSPYLQSYWETALWSSTDEDGRSLDEDFSVEDIVRDANFKSSSALAVDFVEANKSALEEAGLSDEEAAHNHWLTQNGHGAGFWDLGLGKLGEHLTRASKAYGSVDLYVADGKVYST